MLTQECVTRERLSIAGPAGMLAAELVYPAADSASALAVLANPHPLMGGTMHNNVIASLAEQLPGNRIVTLRFDYRGVGESEGDRADVEAAMAEFWRSGHAPQDAGLIADALSIVSWAQRRVALPMAIVGYSFGAYAAVSVICTVQAQALVLVSPTLCQHDFAGFESIDQPVLVIYSDNDFATPRQTTEDWLASLPAAVQSLCVEGGEHFFKGREARIVGAAGAFIHSALARGSR